MADDAEPQVGMDKVEIRHMLRLAGGKPLHAAIALTRLGKAVILLDRRKLPRALMQDIKDRLPDSRLHRFGTFTADADEPKLARFVVNRTAPGMARKLVLALKGTGMRRVEITLEDGTDSEAAEDEDRDHYAQAYDPAKRREAAAAEEEAAELRHDLALLIRQIAGFAGTDLNKRAALAQIAEAAQLHLKRGELKAAWDAIADLRDALS